MARVKGGFTTRRRRKKTLKLAKGYFGSKHALYKTAHEQVMHSLKYAYKERNEKALDCTYQRCLQNERYVIFNFHARFKTC